MENRKELLDTILNEIKGKLNPKVVYLFGSYAKNRENKNSDIDIAVLCKNRINPVLLFNFQLYLGQVANRTVDLIDMNVVGDALKIEIISARYPLYEVSLDYRYKFEMDTISQYVRFNEEREIIFQKKLGLSGGAIWKLF